MSNEETKNSKWLSSLKTDSGLESNENSSVSLKYETEPSHHAGRKKKKKKKKKDTVLDQFVLVTDLEGEIKTTQKLKEDQTTKTDNQPLPSPQYTEEFVTPPVLMPFQEKLLEDNFMHVLEKKSTKNLKAIYHCSICNYHCNNFAVVQTHIADDRHKNSLEKKISDITLQNLPSPTSPQIDAITKLIEDIVAKRGENNSGLAGRRAICDRLNFWVCEHLPGCQIRMLGSSASALALKTSDLNLELVIPSECKAPLMLRTLAEYLEENDKDYRYVRKLFSADHPSIEFISLPLNITCAIVITNQNAYQLAVLLHDYVSFDERVRILGLMIRIFAADCELDKPELGTWPPYAFALLLIYFLQQMNNPVLPVLHEMVVPKPGLSEEIVHSEMIELLRKWKCANTMSVGELWLSFLKFYVIDFAMADYVVCIQQFEPLKRITKNWNGRKIAIEDPYLPKRNVSRTVAHVECFDYAMKCLRTAYKYYAIPQIASSIPLFNHITSQGKPINKHISKDIYHILETNPYFQDNVTQDKTMPDYKTLYSVSKEEALLLVKKLNSKYLSYTYSSSKFSGVQGLPVCCSICHQIGHDFSNCTEDSLEAFAYILPPMQNYFMSAINTFCRQVKEEWAASEEDITRRQQIVAEMETFIANEMKGAQLNVFGSSCNGFGLRKSDLDICLTFVNNQTGKGLDFTKIIENLFHLLHKFKKIENLSAITTAKVPILKFYHTKSGLEGDISVYNILARRNTKLLSTYSDIDPRVKTLGCVVKRFTNVCDINDASRGSLSSYAYLLMLIYFLQQCEPPVLPVLQELEKPEAPQHVIDGFETYFFEDLERLPHIWPAYGGNVSTVGELWLQFLKFYVNFDFKSNVVSIRLQEPLSCFEKLWTSKCMAIEDPFELSHNLGAHLSKKMLVYIIKTLRSAYLRFGTPHLYFMGYRNRLEDFFLNREYLTSGEPPNDRGCRICKKIGHMARDCPSHRPKQNIIKKRLNQPETKGKLPYNIPLDSRHHPGKHWGEDYPYVNLKHSFENNKIDRHSGPYSQKYSSNAGKQTSGHMGRYSNTTRALNHRASHSLATGLGRDANNNVPPSEASGIYERFLNARYGIPQTVHPFRSLLNEADCRRNDPVPSDSALCLRNTQSEKTVEHAEKKESPLSSNLPSKRVSSVALPSTSAPNRGMPVLIPPFSFATNIIPNRGSSVPSPFPNPTKSLPNTHSLLSTPLPGRTLSTRLTSSVSPTIVQIDNSYRNPFRFPPPPQVSHPSYNSETLPCLSQLTLTTQPVTTVHSGFYQNSVTPSSNVTQKDTRTPTSLSSKADTNISPSTATAHIPSSTSLEPTRLIGSPVPSGQTNCGVLSDNESEVVDTPCFVCDWGN